MTFKNRLMGKIRKKNKTNKQKQQKKQKQKTTQNISICRLLQFLPRVLRVNLTESVSCNLILHFEETRDRTIYILIEIDSLDSCQIYYQVRVEN